MTPSQPTTNLPTGVVTFLLTDVADSTPMWEAAPDVMTGVIARHYEILHDAVVAHGGARPVEQGEGDSVVAVFRNGSDAMAAALAAQRALAAEPWPDDIEVAVRMALHTGEAKLRDLGNYAGETIIRAAWLRALAHGGQVVASRQCVDLAGDALPEAAGWMDLGAYRLKGLGRPEQVFQLLHPDLVAEFPPLRGPDSVTNNLPTQLTPFIGREAELAQLHALLDDTRLLTVTGSGGCGKTRLALEAATDRIERHADGIWYVELAPLGETSSVVAALAAVLQIRESAEEALPDALVNRLADQHALIVIDNCEHLLDECATLVEHLLRGCPPLQVMTTSRQPLNLPGEVTWRVPSLRAPKADEKISVASLAQFDAVQLFIDRAVRARPNFTIDNDNAPHVAKICEQLDGIPLAIELAAARVRSVSVSRIAEGLDDRFRLLRGGSTTLLPRQQTLYESIEWSHQLLTEDDDHRAHGRAGDPARGSVLRRARVDVRRDRRAAVRGPGPRRGRSPPGADRLAGSGLRDPRGTGARRPRLGVRGGDATTAGRIHAVVARVRAERGWAMSIAEASWHAGAMEHADDEAAFAAGAQSAEGLTIDDTITMALRARGARLRPASGWPSLTPTELEVAKLVGDGRSNPEIAERLFMSRSTVKTHLNHMFVKLGISTRAELAAEHARREE